MPNPTLSADALRDLQATYDTWLGMENSLERLTVRTMLSNAAFNALPALLSAAGEAEKLRAQVIALRARDAGWALENDELKAVCIQARNALRADAMSDPGTGEFSSRVSAALVAISAVLGDMPGLAFTLPRPADGADE